MDSSVDTYIAISDFDVSTIESLKDGNVQNNIILSMLINLKNYYSIYNNKGYKEIETCLTREKNRKLPPLQSIDSKGYPLMPGERHTSPRRSKWDVR